MLTFRLITNSNWCFFPNQTLAAAHTSNPPGEWLESTHFPYPRQNPNNEMKMRMPKVIVFFLGRPYCHSWGDRQFWRHYETRSRCESKSQHKSPWKFWMKESNQEWCIFSFPIAIRLILCGMKNAMRTQRATAVDFWLLYEQQYTLMKLFWKVEFSAVYVDCKVCCSTALFWSEYFLYGAKN